MAEPTGASESNAGDDFHINWACLRAIDLINPKKNLIQVKLEGLEEEDLRGSDPALFLTADLAEYYSDNSDFESINLASVDRVVISQLKYSTRHTTTEWTVARLCEKKGTRIQRSVISRFADTFLGLSEKYGRDEVLKKLRIKLVSNQPISISLITLLKDVNDYLAKNNQSAIQYAQLKSKMADHYLDDLERLKKATSNLKSSQFVDFLRVICFADCNAENRVSIRRTLAGKVSNNFISPADTDPALLNLVQLVSQQALPSHKSLYLSKESIFHAFGVHHDYEIFPAPPFFEKIKHTIPRAYSRNLANQIITSTGKKMILTHGVAGIGKTTVLQSIHEYLPEGSEVILYDCYGRGDYRKSKEERHSHERALQQLSNEMSLRLGSDWLVKLPSRLEDLQRGFNQRLNMAASALPNQEALLVIVIDAADNSIFASKEAGSNCFVPSMWELDLPDSVRLVMSARTGARADSLQYPKGTELFQIEGFSPQESEEHVRQFFSQASPQQCANFHDQTYGVPRAQFYALNSPEASVDNVLGERAKSLEELFEDRWIAASSGVGGIKLEYLSLLATPIPCELLSVLWGVPESEGLMIVANLKPGAVIDDGYISFRDEDFETFIHEKVVDDETRKELHREIAVKLAFLKDKEIYASVNLARHYHLGGCDSQLLELGLSCQPITTTNDELLKLEILQDRRSRAVLVANKLDQQADVIRLLQLSVESLRSYEAVSDIVFKNPELSVAYADPVVTAKLYLDREVHGQNEKWGEAHFRCAAMLSKNMGNHQKAKHHLKMGHAWLDYWLGLPEEKRRRFTIQDTLIASLVIATFRLEGSKKAYNELNRWKPFDAILRVSWLVAEELASELKPDFLEETWGKFKFHPLVSGLFLVALWKNKLHIPEKLLLDVTKSINNFFSKKNKACSLQADMYSSKPNSYNNARTIDLVEAMVSLGVEESIIRSIAENTHYVIPSYLPYGLDASFALGDAMRVKILTEENELNPHDFLPDKFRQEFLSQNPSEKCKDYLGEIERLLPVLRWRKKCLLGSPDIKDEAITIESLLSAYIPKHFRRQTNEPDFSYKAWSKWLLDGIIFCEGTSTDSVRPVIEKGKESFKNHPIAIFKELAKHIIVDSRYQDIAIDLLEKAVELNKKLLCSASEKRDIFIECTEIVHKYDQELAREYFQLAIESAHLIDATLISTLNYQVALAREIKRVETPESEEAAKRLARIIPVYNSLIDSEYTQPFSPEDAIYAITHLSQKVGAVTVIQWDAMDYKSVSRLMVGYIRCLLEESAIAPHEALALCHLSNGETKLFGDILKQAKADNLTNPEINKLIQIISSWIARDIPCDSRVSASKEVIEWIEQNKYEKTQIYSDLRELHDFANSIESNEYSHSYIQSEADTDETLLFDEFMAALPQPWIENLSIIFESLRKNYKVNHNDVFDKIIQSLTRFQRVEFLDGYLSLPFRSTDMDDLLSRLESCLDLWSIDTKVRIWKEKGIKVLIRRFLPDLLAYEYQGDRNLLRASDLLSDNLAIHRELWFDAIRENMHRLNSWQLNAITNRLIPDLVEDDKIELLRWSVQRSEELLNKYDQTLPDIYLLDKGKFDDTFPALLWTLLGHPVKEIRWQVMHSVRLLVENYDSLILKQLIDINNNSPKSSLAQKPIEFYWMSARQYLYLLLARVAHEKPDYLLDYVDSIMEQATSRAFPHAFIRHMAAETLLTISRKVPDAMTDEQQNELLIIQRPRFNLEPNEKFRKLPRGQERKNQRISFDSMDTEPYWFEKVCRIFHFDMTVMGQEAEKWICDQWGKTSTDVHWSNSNGYQTAWDYTSTGNRHGSLPSIETPRTYWPFHAMFMVAGEMSDKHRVGNLPAETHWSDDWQSFLDYKVPRCSFWFSDILIPTPLNREYWGKQHDTKYEDSSDEYYLDVLQLNSVDSRLFFPLNKSIHIEYSEKRSAIGVETALVNSKTAHALMRALQQEKNTYSYRLPHESDRDNEKTTNFPSFRLKAIINEWSISQPIENQNPQNRGLGEDQTFILPATNLIDHYSLFADDRKQYYYEFNKISQAQNLIFYTEKWNDDPQESHYISTPFSGGTQSWIELDALLSFLNFHKKALIIEVTIERNRKRNEGSSDDDDKPPKHRIFLLHGDGSIESVGKRFSIREKVSR